MARWYVKSDANGANDGTSWEDAFVSPASVDAPLADGDTVYFDSPPDLPFVGEFTFSANSVQYVHDAGPNGQSNWRGGRKSSGWTGPTSNIFQLTGVTTAPTYLAWDFKQDDRDGTVTGWALDAWDLELLEEWGIPEEYAYAYYGFMDRDTSTPTTPAEGKWGHSGTTLYLNPPSTPTLAQVKQLAMYFIRGTVGGVAFAGNNCVWRGRSNFVFYPGGVGGPEYTVQGIGTGGTIRDVYSWTAGYHSASWSGASGANNKILHCFTNSVVGDDSTGNPYVFYQGLASTPKGGHVGRELVFIGAPRFRYDGSLCATTFASLPCQSHTDSGSGMNGIAWRRVLCIDKIDQLEDFHSVTIPGIGWPVLAQHGTITDPFDWSTYASTIEDSYLKGRFSWLFSSHAAGGPGVFIDSHGSGRANLTMPMTGGGGVLRKAWKNGYWITGDSGSASPITIVGSDDSLIFDGVKILTQMTTAKSAIVASASAGSATDRIRIRSCEIDANGVTTHAVIRDANFSSYDANFTDVGHDGHNRFGLGFEAYAYNTLGTASRDFAWMQANISGASTDKHEDLEWGDTEAEKVAFLRQDWLASQQVTPSPHRYRVPSVTRRFIARAA